MDYCKNETTNSVINKEMKTTAIEVTEIIWRTLLDGL